MWYQVFLSNRFIWLIDGILTGTTTVGQSGLGSNGSKEYSKLSRASTSDAV